MLVACPGPITRPLTVLPPLLSLSSPSAIQECPTSGRLWAISIWNEPRPGRKSRSADALKKTNDDANIITAIARLFWTDRKIEKARTWFERAIKANPDVGESWAWWYKFELEHGTQVSRDAQRFYVCI